MGRHSRTGRKDRQSAEATNQKSLQIMWKEGETILRETEKESIVTFESMIEMGAEGIGAKHKASGN